MAVLDGVDELFAQDGVGEGGGLDVVGFGFDFGLFLLGFGGFDASASGLGGIKGGFHFVGIADFLKIDVFDVDAELFPVLAEFFEEGVLDGFAVAVDLEGFVVAERGAGFGTDVLCECSVDEFGLGFVFVVDVADRIAADGIAYDEVNVASYAAGVLECDLCAGNVAAGVVGQVAAGADVTERVVADIVFDAMGPWSLEMKAGVVVDAFDLASERDKYGGLTWVLRIDHFTEAAECAEDEKPGGDKWEDFRQIWFAVGVVFLFGADSRD